MAQINFEADIEAAPRRASQQSQNAPTSSHDERVVTDLDQHWVSTIQERLLIEPTTLKASATRELCSIYRVPQSLRQFNQNAYDPQVVSIGPFHYQKRGGPLKAMQEHKWRYLRDILSRNPEGSLRRYLAAVKELEEVVRNCYAEVIMLDSNCFVEMMVLDCCFILEFIRNEFFIEHRHDPLRHDPLFQLAWLKKAIWTDLLLLENQIPFRLLQCLFNLINPTDSPLVERVLEIFGSPSMMERINQSNIQIHHLLHLHHTYHVLLTEENCPQPWTFERIPCASKLEEAGIKFRKRDDVNNSGDILGINFHKGVIEIPPIQVWDKTNIRLLNVIAFEHCYFHCKTYFIAYASFMDCLINSSKDVEILCEKGIIDNDLGNEESVAAFYNRIGREVPVCGEEFYLSCVCKEINRYRKRAWPKLRASLVHDYFKSPWAIISFLAALLLLLLTVIQAFFSSFPKFAYGN